MFLIQPRHELSSLNWEEGSFSQMLLYDLATWREEHTDMAARVIAECGFALLTLASLIETTVRLPFALLARCLGSDRGVSGYTYSCMTFVLSLYGLCLNLFTQALSPYLTFLHARLHSKLEAPLYWSVRYGDKELAKFLLESGADPHQRFDTHSSALAAHLFNQPHMQDLFTLNDYERQYLDTKLVAHWHNLRGNVFVDGTEVRLEGGQSPFFFNIIRNYLDRFFFLHRGDVSLSEEGKETLLQALQINSNERGYQKVVDRIQRKELAFIDAGWEEHGICLAFFGNYMAIGNRGPGSEKEGTLKVFRIDPRKVTPALVEQIKCQQHRAEEKGIDYFYRTLPKQLSKNGQAQQDALCKRFCSVAPSFAKSGNCALSSKKAALQFAWSMLLSTNPSDLQLAQAKNETQLFSDWAAVHIGGIHSSPLEQCELVLRKTASIVRKHNRYHTNVTVEDSAVHALAERAFQLNQSLQKQSA